MGWKRYSYKKRGLIIGAVIGFLIGWLGFYTLFHNCNGFADSVSCSFWESLIWSGHIITGIFLLIVGILIGWLSGFVIEKIKK